MAKSSKTKDAAENAATEKEKPEGFGIQYLAAELEKEPHLVRAQLRRMEIEKTDGRYFWSTQKEADKVVSQLQKDSKENSTSTTPAKAETKAPAAKGKRSPKGGGDEARA
jgi:hypothetical protein